MGEKENVWEKFWTPGVTREFSIEKPISEYVRTAAENNPDQTAVSFYGNSISYRALNAAIDRFAWGLVGLGLQKGTRVAVQMPNCPQFIICYFGILRAGGMVVAMNPMFKAAELEYEIKDATPEIFICADYLFREVEKIRGRVPLRHIIVTSLNEYLPERPRFALPDEVRKLEIICADTLSFQKVLAESEETPSAV